MDVVARFPRPNNTVTIVRRTTPSRPGVLWVGDNTRTTYCYEIENGADYPVMVDDSLPPGINDSPVTLLEWFMKECAPDDDVLVVETYARRGGVSVTGAAFYMRAAWKPVDGVEDIVRRALITVPAASHS